MRSLTRRQVACSCEIGKTRADLRRLALFDSRREYFRLTISILRAVKPRLSLSLSACIWDTEGEEIPDVR